MSRQDFILWEDTLFVVKTLANPHLAYVEGMHIIVAPKRAYESAWENTEMSGKAFELASKVSRIVVSTGMAPWINLQANGNWGLLPGASPSFHIHIYGRNVTESWAKPILLPELPGTYNNDPMPAADRSILVAAFKDLSV